jgi:hypothetical protein
MPDESDNCRLTIFTNSPGDAATYEASGWKMSNLYVLKFSPAMQPDLIHRKLYAMQFWKPKRQLKQPELL